MKTDPRYGEKAEVLRKFFLDWGVLRSLEQARRIFGYANRASARQFLRRLVSDGFLVEEAGGKYSPSVGFVGIPYFESVRAGLPFTPEAPSDRKLDVNAYLIERPVSTYLVRVKGDSMSGAWITDGDVAVVDRSLPAANGDIVIASVGWDVTIKRYRSVPEGAFLDPENPAYSPIRVADGDELLGIVVGIVRKYR